MYNFVCTNRNDVGKVFIEKKQLLKVSMMQKMTNIYLILTFNNDSLVKNFY